ncbi:hypothetical protein [Acinetobacter sp. LUNF3]|nr:hypothetical protein [Acinetobacter sp. LUNF3]
MLRSRAVALKQFNQADAASRHGLFQALDGKVTDRGISYDQLL